jgi:transaldolase / glucose-6-phosphate isomerase
VGRVETAELVERLWARDASLWTNADEGRWLGWLDEPSRMLERVPELQAFAQEASGFEDVVLLGMGGSSLAPEVLRRRSGVSRFHVLDSTHPGAVRVLAESVALERTLFLVASKSGTTLETRCHLDYFWERADKRGESFAAITDPGSELEKLARERSFSAVFLGEPTIGGRYSALSVFGMVPAVLMGIDVGALLEDASEMSSRCRSPENPGLELGLRLGTGWLEGRDKVVFENPHGFGLWLEQLLAESTGKAGRGLVPAPGETTDGLDRQAAELRLGEDGPGAEFYRWEFATAVAGSILEINPFDQPNVQEAKDRTADVLSGHDRGQTPGMSEADGGGPAAVAALLAEAREGDYVAVQAFVDPAREGDLSALLERARATGCVVTSGLGPRYLHSTGQLHKGGPPTGRFVQVVDDPGAELPIPGRPFGFRRLIHAQADGDLAALRERGRPIVRVTLDDLEAL